MTGRAILRLKKPSKRTRTTAQVIEDDCRRPTGVECLAELAGHYPALFDPANPKPLALGIHKAMSADSGMSRTRIRRGLREWTRHVSYLCALTEGGPRYGIDGKPDGVVTEWEQAQAVKRLEFLPE